MLRLARFNSTVEALLYLPAGMQAAKYIDCSAHSSPLIPLLFENAYRRVEEMSLDREREFEHGIQQSIFMQ